MTQALQYVDATMPDDTGDGLIPGTAKRTPRAAQQNISSGGKILIKTGYCYDPVLGNFLIFSGVSNVEVGTYGTASDKPILDALTYQNPGVSGWTLVSGGIWKKIFAAYPVRRIWVGSTSAGILTTQRVIGTAKRRATGSGLTTPTANPTEAAILAALDANNIWFCGGALTSYALYIYTGSATIDPPTYYGGIALLQADGSTVGAVDGVHIQNQTGIYAHDLHFRGNGSVGIRMQAQNSDTIDAGDCLFENCIVTAPYQGAFRSGIAAEASPARRIRGVTVRRIYCDYTSSADEMELNTTYNYLSGVVDLFNVYDGSVGVTIDGCTAINSAHNGIVTGSIAMSTTPPTGCRVTNNIIRYDAWHTYARGMSSFDADTIFSGNLIDGQNTRSQFAGSCDVHGNIWINMRNCVRKTGVAQWVAFESYVYDSFFAGATIADRYVKINPVNVRFRNNLAYSPQGTVWSFNHYNTGKPDTSNNYPTNSITVANNVCFSPAGLTIDTYQDTGRVVTPQIIQNNCVFNGAVGDNKVTWIGSGYSINSAPGCSANQEIDPVLGLDYRSLSPALKRTGASVIGKDFNGKQFYNPPNIGAVDDLSSTSRYLVSI